MTPEIRALLMSHRAETCLECGTQPNAFELLRRARRASQPTPPAMTSLPAAAGTIPAVGHAGVGDPAAAG